MYTNIREKVQTTEYDKQKIECVNKQPFYTGKKQYQLVIGITSRKSLMPSEIEDRVFMCFEQYYQDKQEVQQVQMICTSLKTV